MIKSEVVIDLIAHAYGLTQPEERVMLKEYLDLYVVAINLDAFSNCFSEARAAELVGGQEFVVPLKMAQGGIIEKPSASEAPAEYGKSTVQQPSGETAPPKQVPRPPGQTLKPFTGKGATEKTAIYNRLHEYREKHGLGSYGPLVEASDGKLTDTAIRMMYDAARMPLSDWKLLETALDKVGNKTI